MKEKIGKFFFRYRNALGPCIFLLTILIGEPLFPFGRLDLNIALDLVGVMVALCGQALRIVTIGYEYIERGGKNRQVYASKLIQGGVFAHCRNPLYVGNILIAAGLAFIVNSYIFYLIAIPFILFTYRCIVAAEEAFLSEKFGKEYIHYCRRVNRWWPRWKGWKHSTVHMHFNWKRVLVKEYNTLFILVLSIVTVILWTEYRIIGPGALPNTDILLTGLIFWVAFYIIVRACKKAGYVKG